MSEQNKGPCLPPGERLLTLEEILRLPEDGIEIVLVGEVRHPTVDSGNSGKEVFNMESPVVNWPAGFQEPGSLRREAEAWRASAS